MGDGTGSSGANTGNNPGSGGMSTPGGGNTTGGSGAGGAAAAGNGPAATGGTSGNKAGSAAAGASAASAAAAGKSKSESSAKSTAATGNIGSGAKTSAGAAAAAARAAAGAAATGLGGNNKSNASPGAGAGAAASAARAAAAASGGLAKAAAAQGGALGVGSRATGPNAAAAAAANRAGLGVGAASGHMAASGLAGPNAAAEASRQSAARAGMLGGPGGPSFGGSPPAGATVGQRTGGGPFGTPGIGAMAQAAIGAQRPGGFLGNMPNPNPNSNMSHMGLPGMAPNLGMDQGLFHDKPSVTAPPAGMVSNIADNPASAALARGLAHQAAERQAQSVSPTQGLVSQFGNAVANMPTPAEQRSFRERSLTTPAQPNLKSASLTPTSREAAMYGMLSREGIGWAAQMVGPSVTNDSRRSMAANMASEALAQGVNPMGALAIAAKENPADPFANVQNYAGSSYFGPTQIGFREAMNTGLMPTGTNRQNFGARLTSNDDLAAQVSIAEMKNRIGEMGNPSVTGFYGGHLMGPATASRMTSHPDESAVQARMTATGETRQVAEARIRANMTRSLRDQGLTTNTVTSGQFMGAHTNTLNREADRLGLTRFGNTTDTMKGTAQPADAPSTPSPSSTATGVKSSTGSKSVAAAQAQQARDAIGALAARAAMAGKPSVNQAASGAKTAAAQRGLVAGDPGLANMGYADAGMRNMAMPGVRSAPTSTEKSNFALGSFGNLAMTAANQPGFAMGPQSAMNPGTPSAMDTGRTLGGMIASAMNPGTPGQMNAPSARATGLTSSYADAGQRNPNPPGVRSAPTSTQKADLGMFGQQSGTTAGAMAAAAQQSRMASMDATRMSQQAHEHQVREAVESAVAQAKEAMKGSFTNRAMTAANQPTSAYGTGSFKNRAMTSVNQPKASNYSSSFPNRAMNSVNQPAHASFSNMAMAAENQPGAPTTSTPTVSHPPNPTVGTPPGLHVSHPPNPTVGTSTTPMASTPLGNIALQAGTTPPGNFAQPGEVGNLETAISPGIKNLLDKLGPKYSDTKAWGAFSSMFGDPKALEKAGVVSLNRSPQGGWSVTMKDGTIVNTDPKGGYTVSKPGVGTATVSKDGRVSTSVAAGDFMSGLADASLAKPGIQSPGAQPSMSAFTNAQTRPSVAAPTSPFSDQRLGYQTAPVHNFAQGPRLMGDPGVPSTYGPSPGNLPLPGPAPAPAPAPSPPAAAPPAPPSAAPPPGVTQPPSHFGPPTRPNLNGFPNTTVSGMPGGLPSGVNNNGMQPPVPQFASPPPSAPAVAPPTQAAAPALNLTPEQAQATLDGIQNGTIGSNLSPEALQIVIQQLQGIINSVAPPSTPTTAVGGIRG